MARLWFRKGRGYYATIRGKQRMLGTEYQAAVKALEALVGKGGHRPTDGPTVGRILDEWTAHQARAVTPRRLATLRHYLKAEKMAAVRALPCDAAGPDDLAAWLESRETWGPSTRWVAGKAVIAAFNWAVRVGRVGKNPFQHTPLPRPRRRTSCPTDEEVTAALDKARHPRVRDYFELLWLTGARGGELAVLEAKDLDLPAGVARLVEHKTARKTGRERTIYLPPRAVEILARLAEEHPAGPLLRTPKGAAWTADYAAYHLKKMGARWTRHSLRHAYISDALCKGLDVATVAELAGHTTPHMVLSVYSHPSARRAHMREAVREVRGGAA